MREIHGSDEANTAEQVGVVARPYFSSHPMASSATLADHAKRIEDEHTGEPRFDLHHRGYVVWAIVSAAGFLEALVNELFQDAFDDHAPPGGAITPLDDQARRLMAEYWRATDRGRLGQTLSKFQALLTFTRNPALNKGDPLYQDAQAIIDLRNALVHFRPQDLSPEDPDKMELRLKGRFADNKIMVGSGNPWWPNQCLGWGCARWSLQAVTAVADHLVLTTGVEPAYVRFRAENQLGNVP